MKAKLKLNGANVTSLMVITSLAVAFIFNATLLNIDRSRSIYVLSWVNNQDINFKEGKIFIRVKSPESVNEEAIRLRVDENLKRGLIANQGQILKLTFSGTVVLKFNEVMANIFKLKNWKINSE
jgi:hypothetical protein